MGRHCYVLLALILVIHVSWSTCTTVQLSDKKGTLSPVEADTVYNALLNIVQDIRPERDYYSGRIFYKYIKVGGKGVAVRLTRWNPECSVSMSESETTKGSELKAAFRTLLPTLRPYVGDEWVAVSNHTFWIDYFVRGTYGDSELEAPSEKSSPKRFVLPGSGGSVTDCSIQPSMLLSHYSADDFNKLNAGDSLQSPNGKYELVLYSAPFTVRSFCSFVLRDVKTHKPLWTSAVDMPRNNCFLRFRAVGTLELWNNNKLIWKSDSACSETKECAGAASLVVDNDGALKLFRSVDDHLAVYWSTLNLK